MVMFHGIAFFSIVRTDDTTEASRLMPDRSTAILRLIICRFAPLPVLPNYIHCSPYQADDIRKVDFGKFMKKQ